MSEISPAELEKFISYIHCGVKTAESVREKARKRSAAKGEVIFDEKDNVDMVYFVLEGKVTMYRLGEEGHKRVIYILGAGEFVNEVIFDGLSASVSCEAFENCELICLYKQDLLEIMAGDFELTRIILTSMGRKIRRLYRQLKNTIPIKLDKKLAAKLWKLSRDYGVETEEGVLIDIDISITYLASMLGSARETVSKCMSRFEKEGLIKYKGKKILVPDRNALSVYFRGIEE